MTGNPPAEGEAETDALGDSGQQRSPRPPAESTAGIASAVEPRSGPGGGDDLPRFRAGELLAGRFSVLRFLARGGMGAVYEATDVLLRTRVAIKVIDVRFADPPAMERFRREVLLARRIGHPNVCHVYELYETRTAADVPIHFLTMEFLEGETLAARLAREGRLSTAEALPLVRQMCDGLAAAHAEGVIHRDFKSSNVMLVPRSEDPGQGGPRVAITDFGVARGLEQRDGPETDALTGGAGILGTPEYMAPEQVTGSAVSPATDIYALGVVMYQMVTGRLPFSGESRLATAARRIEAPPPRPELAVPGLDARWSRTILRCLDREPRRRFEHARDVAGALLAGQPRRRWVLPAAVIGVLLLALAGTLVGRKPAKEGGATSESIAVLPFVDMSPEHDQEYFSDGVAQEIMSSLTQVPGLRVAARSSSFSFKGKNEDLRSVGQKLNVRHVLEGSVRKSGDRLRITAQVVSAADGYQLWSQSFDRELIDVFAIQDEIARAVVTALQVKVLPGSRAPEPQVTRPEVYALYLRGQQLANTGRLADLPKAIAEFRKAIALDPSYAPAHAGLGASLVWFGALADASDLQQFEGDWRRDGLAEAERALALNPKLVEAYLARGIAHAFVTWDWSAARADYERALALAPGDINALRQYAQILVILGRPSEAIPHARLAVDLDPLSAAAHFQLGNLYTTLGRYSAARPMLEKAVSLAPGAFASRWLGYNEVLDGDPGKALALFQSHPVEWTRLFGTAIAQYSLGDDAASRRALAELIATSPEVAPFQIAQAYAWRGENDKAFEWLERAYLARDPGLCWVKSDPFLRRLHGDPRFAAFLGKMKLPVD